MNDQTETDKTQQLLHNLKLQENLITIERKQNKEIRQVICTPHL